VLFGSPLQRGSIRSSLSTSLSPSEHLSGSTTTAIDLQTALDDVWCGRSPVPGECFTVDATRGATASMGTLSRTVDDFADSASARCL